MNFNVVQNKSTNDIVREWDLIAPVRINQILSGKDLTFDNILSPSIINLVSDEKSGRVLDAGCGVGVLTSRLSGLFDEVIGIDPSSVSIEIAQENFGNHARFFVTTAEEFALNSKARFDVIVANMVLMDVIDLNRFTSACAKLLKPGGTFVFSTTHPYFWAEYYGYAQQEWYKYHEEIMIESPFRISNHQDCRLISTHVHRPLEKYVTSFERAGLFFESALEPMPNATIADLYPRRWKNPHYLLGRCRRPRRFRAI